MNCLTYLLDLWERGHRFKIFYDENHCIGVNETKIFDLNNTYKKDILRQSERKYLPLKYVHTKEQVIESFNLETKWIKILECYYE
jgi:hypothetical protein